MRIAYPVELPCSTSVETWSNLRHCDRTQGLRRAAGRLARTADADAAATGKLVEHAGPRTPESGRRCPDDNVWIGGRRPRRRATFQA
jgi:hypothetical protein